MCSRNVVQKIYAWNSLASLPMGHMHMPYQFSALIFIWTFTPYYVFVVQLSAMYLLSFSS